MAFSIRGLLFNLICSVALGYWLAPSWFGLVELVGIVALVGCVIVPFQDEAPWLSLLRTGLFAVGGGLTLLSTLAAGFVGFNSFVGWLMIVCLWTTLSSFVLELQGSLNRFQIGGLLYVIVSAGLGLGYLGSGYFNP